MLAPTPTIGHNQPPGPIDYAKEAMADINTFLREHPVIENHDQARAAGGWIERTRIALKSMEEERTVKVAPLIAINESYCAVSEPLKKILLELRRRVTAYTSAEEAKRKAEAERARRAAEEAERQAQAAIAAADDAIACADVGECTDAGTAIAEADAAIRDAGRLARSAARAERESTVRIGSVMGGRAISMRTTEVLIIDDPGRALKVLGLTEKIAEAILSSARDFRREFGELPDGVRVEQKRSV